ncbi:hypothetical protein RQP46_011387 [Phenoliferia psychrophenolica]
MTKSKKKNKGNTANAPKQQQQPKQPKKPKAPRPPKPPAPKKEPVVLVPFPQWTRLNLDIKTCIIEWVFLLECRDEDDGGAAPMASAMLVSRELHMLASPFYWREMFFTGRSLYNVQQFIDEILPSRGHHIHRTSLPVTVPHYRGQVVFIGGDAPKTDSQGAARRALYAIILSKLSNLESLTVQLRYDMPEHNGPLDQASQTLVDRYPDDDEPERHGELLLAISSIGAQLRVLQLYGDEEYPMDPTLIASTISNCPNLACLFLTYVDKSPSNSDDLLVAVQGLAHLHSLELNQVADVTEKWAESPNWTAPVKVIHLHLIKTLTSTTFVKFFQHFAASLVQIRVQHATLLDTPSTTPNLPHLIWLTIWSGKDALGFVDSFSSSPLKRLEIDTERRACYTDSAKLLETVGRFSETLEDLEIASPVEKGVLERWGAENSIKVQVDYGSRFGFW